MNFSTNRHRRARRLFVPVHGFDFAAFPVRVRQVRLSSPPEPIPHPAVFKPQTSAYPRIDSRSQ
jgi:hypothetical protein